MRKFLRSFVVGFLGLGHAIRAEQNMRIHCVVALGVLVVGFVLGLAVWEWMVLLFCIGLVISAECMNTALERLADRVTKEKDPLIQQAKDCGSAAVLVLAITTAIIGGLLFVPRILNALG